MSELAEGSTIGPYPYRIIRRLGHKQGNMAEVYLAAVGDNPDPNQVNVVVVKITRVDEEHGDFFRATLENEVERLRRLKHPGIVRLYPVQKTGLRNLPYMAQTSLPTRPWFSVMEYLAGGSLANLLEVQKQLDIGTALEIARSLASTLDYLHNLNQVHLDIKPENILFRESLQPGHEPQPVLIDFGIARTVGQAGLEAGTLQWSPPERIRYVRGDKPPELTVRPQPSMDIYALGMVLYTIIAGRLPFADRTRKGITTAILDGHPTAPSRYQPLVQRELDELILMMIAPDPAQRPTADAVARTLEDLAIRLNYRPRYGFITTSNSLAASKAPTTASGGSKARVLAAVLGLVVLLETAFIAVRVAPALIAGEETPNSPRRHGFATCCDHGSGWRHHNGIAHAVAQGHRDPVPCSDPTGDFDRAVATPKPRPVRPRFATHRRPSQRVPQRSPQHPPRSQNQRRPRRPLRPPAHRMASDP